VNDILLAPSGHDYAGNVWLRGIVAERKKAYLSAETKKLETAHIAAKIVHSIRRLDPPGRFLQEGADGSGVWWDIGDAMAYKKVAQALREDWRWRDREAEIGCKGKDRK
jgi:hypothetical protein